MITAGLVSNRSDEEHLSVRPGPSGLGLFFLAVLSISGCDFDRFSDSSLNICDTRSCRYSDITPLGIKYRTDVVYSVLSATQIDNTYKAVSACFGLWFKPNVIVVFTNDLKDGQDGQIWYNSPDLILIRWNADKTIMQETLLHEFIHYFHVRAYPLDGGDPNHSSSIWDTCI